MEFRLIIKDTRDKLEVYETKIIDLKDLDKMKDPAAMLLHTVTEMRKKVEDEFARPRKTMPVPTK